MNTEVLDIRTGFSHPPKWLSHRQPKSAKTKTIFNVFITKSQSVFSNVHCSVTTRSDLWIYGRLIFFEDLTQILKFFPLFRTRDTEEGMDDLTNNTLSKVPSVIR